MASIVETLQREALNPSTSVCDLLRKAKFVASKLDLPELEHWADDELDGYQDIDELPDYRKANGQPIWRRPGGRWQPITFSGRGVEHAVKLSRGISWRRSASSRHRCRQQDNPPEMLEVSYPPGTVDAIGRSMGITPIVAALRVNASAVNGVIQAIRTKVLDWALKLEKAGVSGSSEAMGFSPEEKEAAHANVIYNIGSITHLAGTLGPASGNAVIAPTQTVETALSMNELIAYIREHAADLALPADEADKLHEHLAEREGASAADQSDSGVVRRVLSSIRGIAGRTSNTVLEITINALIDRYLGPGA